MLLVLLFEGPRHNSKACNTVWQCPTTSSTFAEAIESIPIQKIIAFRVAFCAVGPSVDIDPSPRVRTRLVSLILWVVHTLAVEDAGIVCPRVETVHVLELPVDAFLPSAEIGSKIISLVHKASRSVTSEQISEVEAVTQNRHAESREGQGFGGVLVATCLFRAIGKEAQCYILAKDL